MSVRRTSDPGSQVPGIDLNGTGGSRGSANSAPGGSGRRATRKAKAGRRSRGSRRTATKTADQLPKNLRDLCGPCCVPGYDGGLSKPQFNSSGAPYVAPRSTENFFSRGSGTFYAGKTKKKAQYVPGAVHSVEEKVVPRKKPQSSLPAFKPSNGVGDLFSVETSLGPADQAMAPPARSGGMKVGKYQPKKKIEPPVYHAAREFAYVKEPEKHLSKDAPKFKSGAPGGDFFDPAMYMSEPIGDYKEPPAKKPIGGVWKPSGQTKEPLGKFPEHQPDPFGIKPPPGAETRHKGAFGICCIPAGGGRSLKPVAWYKTRTGDVYRTRDLKAAAAASGMPTGSKMNITRETLKGSGARMVSFDWSM